MRARSSGIPVKAPAGALVKGARMSDLSTWFTSWDRLESIAVSSVALYVLIVVLVRVMGKRVTGQMNSFDWIITVAVGSLLASGILQNSVSVSDAALAIGILAACQWLMTKASVRSQRFEKLVKPAPRLLVHKGAYLDAQMEHERVTRAEVDAALREQGHASIDEVNWVVLETDGTMSVVPRMAVPLDKAGLMRQVAGHEKLDETPPQAAPRG